MLPQHLRRPGPLLMQPHSARSMMSCCASGWALIACWWVRAAALAPLWPSACVNCVTNVLVGTYAMVFECRASQGVRDK